jgi:chemotaxis protein MotB
MKAVRKREVHQEGTGWEVSYADMMTLLLCFFVMLYALSDPDQGKMDAFSESMGEAFKSEHSPTRRVDYISREERVLNMLLGIMDISRLSDKVVRRIEREYEKAKTQRKLDGVLNSNRAHFSEQLKFLKNNDNERSVSIILPQEFLFPRNSMALSGAARMNIVNLAGVIKSVDGILAVEVIGHDDSQTPPPPGSDKWSLSAARAGQVALELNRNGVDREMIAVKGLADTSPMYPEKDRQGRVIMPNLEKNRRVEIVIKKRVDE